MKALCSPLDPMFSFYYVDCMLTNSVSRGNQVRDFGFSLGSMRRR